jgi:hypothetical protein
MDSSSSYTTGGASHDGSGGTTLDPRALHGSNIGGTTDALGGTTLDSRVLHSSNIGGTIDASGGK